jgi:hypothetical protein
MKLAPALSQEARDVIPDDLGCRRFMGYSRKPDQIRTPPEDDDRRTVAARTAA